MVHRESRRFFTTKELREFNHGEVEKYSKGERQDADFLKTTPTGRNYSTEKTPKFQNQGIRSAMSSTTTDSQRVNDFIIPSRHYHGAMSRAERRKQTLDEMSSSRDRRTSQLSEDASVVSNWSRPSVVRPLFQVETKTHQVSKQYSSESGRPGRASKEDIDDDNQRGDDPWRAAKRGDLKALKKFHGQSKIDWGAEDRNGNIPLFYACQSGAIVDTSVVSFLLWVTPVKSEKHFEKCRKNAINREVQFILEKYEEGGISAVGPRDSNVRYATSKKSSRFKFMKSRKRHGGKSHTSLIISDQDSLKQSHEGRGVFEKRNKNVANDKGETNLSSSPKEPYRDGSTDETNTDARKIISEHSFGSMLDDVKKSESSVISTPSIDSDSWSIGSFLSFRRRQKSKNSKEKGGIRKRQTGFPQIEEHRDENADEDRSSPLRQEDNLVARQQNPVQGQKSGVLKTPPDSKYRSHPEGSKLTRDSVSLMSDIKSAAKSRYGTPSCSATSRDDVQSKSRVEKIGRKAKIEYHDKERKWYIRDHVHEASAKTGKIVASIHVNDAKQQVYVANCHGMTLQIYGQKFKALLVENCSDMNVVFDTVITTCDVLDCKNLAVQTTGVCPTFAIDKTDEITVWLSHESLKVSRFVTSKSTGVNISVPASNDDDWERKELSLPNQFVHQFSGGKMSQVSRPFG